MRASRAIFIELLVFLAFGATCYAEGVEPFGYKPGYLSSVQDEREQREVEMVVVPQAPPALAGGRPLVDSRLTREFQSQYEVKFGRTEAERNSNASNRYAFFEYPSGRQESLQAHAARQRQFGEYMFRRLTEHHVDQYAKSNPDVRPLYELKDRIANVDVKVRQGYKLRFKYSYSGNFLDMRIDNPYNIGAKVSFQMGSGFGPSAIERTIYSLNYAISKRVSLAAFQEVDVKTSTAIVGTRTLTKSLAANITAAHAVPVDRDRWETSPRQDLFLVGLSWSE